MSIKQQPRASARSIRLPTLGAGLLVAVSSLVGAARAAEKTVTASITYLSSDGVFLDHGLDLGLVRDLTGVVKHAAVEVGRVRIDRLSARSSFASFVTGAERIALGDSVTFALPEVPAAERQASATTAASEPPLLAPMNISDSTVADVVGGAVGFRSSLLRDAELDRSFVYSRVFTRGTLDRIDGEPWSLEWDLEANRRDGSGYAEHADYQEIQGRVDLFALTYHGEDGRFAIGRLDPLVIASIGPVDGVQLDRTVARDASLGLLAGLRPDRRTLGFRAREWAIIPYTSVLVGDPDATQATTSAAVELSWFDGEADRQALHLEELLSFGKTLRLRFTSELDLYTSSDQRSGVGLTRLSAIADLFPGDPVSWYARAFHFERPDTLAERALTGDSVQFDAGHHVLAIGSRQRADGGWSWFEEIGYVDGASTDADYQGRIGASKYGLFGLDRASCGAEVFNTVGIDQSGFGGRVYARWSPLTQLDLGLSYDSSRIDYDSEESTTLTSSSVSLDAFWSITDQTSLDARYAHLFGDGLRGDSVDVGLTVRF
ncbi:MAG: hypothetical protein U1E76_24435 [Planctomycetota bacterium]